MKSRFTTEADAVGKQPVRKIPIAKTWFDSDDRSAMLEPLESGWVVQGPKVRQFEQAFAEYTGIPHCVAVSSCTTALHLAYLAAEVKPGDEVIVPAFTWIATANMVELSGARPVFCDIDLATFNLRTDLLESLITPRTRAIVPVHLFGLPANLHDVMALAQRHNLGIIEDAACAFGAFYRGAHVGGFGAVGCFSFHPRKAITTGEGGMVTTRDARLADLVRSLRDHGATRSDLSRHTGSGTFLLSEYPHRGYNYRMTDFQGALGVSQMAKAPEIQHLRVQAAARYDRLLRDCRFLRTPVTPGGMTHGYQSYVCMFESEGVRLDQVPKRHERRNRLMQALEERGIATRQGTHAVTLQSYYQKQYGIADTDYPNALVADKLSLALPLYPQLTGEDQEYVVENLNSAYQELT